MRSRPLPVAACTESSLEAVMGHGSAEPQRGPVEWLGAGACRSSRDMQKDVIEPPSRPPMPTFGERVKAQAQASPRTARTAGEDTDSSSGDEICFSGKPLLASEQADSVPKASLGTPPNTEPSKEARLAAVRARMQTLGCSKKERKDAQQDNLDRGDDSAKCIELPAGDFGSGPDVSMLPSSVFEKPKRVDEPGTEAEAPHRGDRPRSGVTSSEGSEDESQEHNQRSWWAQFFRLRLLQTPGAASLCVPLARMGLQDTDLPSVTASLDRLLEDLRGERLDTLAESSESLHRPPVRALLEIDLSDNSISDPGAVFLFRWLLRRRKEVRCRAIRLARNKLGDASMEWLAALICAQHSAIEEIHLSQNRITGSGAGQLLLSLALHPFEAYVPSALTVCSGSPASMRHRMCSLVATF